MNGQTRKTLRLIVLLAAIAMLAAVSLPLLVRAQSGLALRWGNVAGGYGISSGEGYRVAGTSGEAEAGSVSGEGYHVSAGFWGAVDEPPPWLPPTAVAYRLFLPAAVGD
jgi:hypothetical protein